MDRVAEVYFEGRLAGVLTQTSDDVRFPYRFRYNSHYLAGGTPLSFNLPLQEDAYVSEQLFPFFENLVSEGWLRKLQSQLQKVDENDRFGLLLLNGEDLVGAVTVVDANPSVEPSL